MATRVIHASPKPGGGAARGAQEAAAQRRSAPATRVEILKSAAAAFRKLGYHGATVEQIAAALQMKKGNLYYYFRNKEEILFACHQYSLDRLLRSARRDRAARRRRRTTSCAR